MSANTIVENLVKQGHLTPDIVAIAESHATETGQPLLRVLVDQRHIQEETLFQAAAEFAEVPFVEPQAIQIDEEAKSLLPGDRARRIKALPFGWHEGTLMVAVSDLTDLNLRDDLTRSTGYPITFCLAPPTALSRRIVQVYRSDAEMGALSEEIGGASAAYELEQQLQSLESEGDDDAPVIRYVDLLINQAIHDRASDVHIEPTETEVNVRYRIDGVLQAQTSASKSILSGIVSRIKVLSGMDIAERRIPQDGRMSLTVDGKGIDLRVTTLPTVHGEKIVMRILDQNSTPLLLSEVGMSQHILDTYRDQYTRPHGMLLATGPTGSGKSTTLYATLNEIRNPQTSIVTVEDPVEYRIPEITQIQVSNKSGLTFASALRSILRADPDVVLVGEIRDRETAQIAVEAALTGHLVLSSLHTNDATSAATRLVEMGLEPFLVGAALRSVVAQRLVRRLCPKCRQQHLLTEEERVQLQIPADQYDETMVVYRPNGCEYCNYTGYRGRIPLQELFVIDETTERMINENAHSDHLRSVAIQNGMLIMKQDGWMKVFSGDTSVEEVLRVAG